MAHQDSWIAFYVTPGGLAGDTPAIWIMDSNGNNLKRLTNPKMEVGNPFLSPKGAIAFPVQIGTTEDIYVIDPDGNNLRRVTFIEGPVLEIPDEGDKPIQLSFFRHCSWSPDGTKIAFSSGHPYESQIFVLDVSSQKIMQLTKTGRSHNPCWSPDGSQIVYSFSRERQGKSEIWVIDADGSNPTSLTQSVEESCSSPQWSPDGARIIFATSKSGLAIINSDGSNLRRLTYLSDDDAPVWSPDGSQVAFSAGYLGSGGVYVVNADGSSLRRRLCNLSKKQLHVYLVMSLVWGPRLEHKLPAGSKTLSDDWISHAELGLAYRFQGKDDLALVELQNSLAKNRDDSSALTQIGMIYYGMGDRNRAIATLEKAITLNHKDARAYLVLGDLYEKQGKIHEAIIEYQHAVLFGDPLESANAHLSLGIFYAKQGDWDTAIQEWEACIDIYPNLAGAHSNLGIAYGTRGQLRRGIEELERALKLDPNNPGALHYLPIFRQQLDEA